VAQWVAAAGATLQRGAASVHATEAAQVAQKEASTGAHTARQREEEGATMSEISAAKTDEAMLAKADEASLAEAGRADERAVPVVTERAAVEAAPTSSLLGNQPGGRGEEREVHTISSDEPPRPHGKAVMAAKMSSTAEMPPPVRRGGQESGATWPSFASGIVHGLSQHLSSWAAPRRRRRKHTGRSLRGLGIWPDGLCRCCSISLPKTYPMPSR
jgi:hypothetical protein